MGEGVDDLAVFYALDGELGDAVAVAGGAAGGFDVQDGDGEGGEGLVGVGHWLLQEKGKGGTEEDGAVGRQSLPPRGGVAGLDICLGGSIIRSGVTPCRYALFGRFAA